MGSFTFKWPHAAEEVFVTGTFDDWSKTEQLEKVGDVFEKEVRLRDTSEKIYYKFVVDGKWTTDPDAPRETDHEGNENNVLKPEDMVEDPAVGLINTVGPGSTTAQLAAMIPLEKQAHPNLPGEYPETPAIEPEKQLKINPLPAVDGAVNPISLAPGEKIPDAIASGSLTKNVHLDKDSYENSDALPGVAGISDITINTVGPESTTAQLAGEVPLEPKPPAVVKESQAKAGVDVEPISAGKEVADKADAEKEPPQKVHEAAATSAGTASMVRGESEGDRTAAEAVAFAAPAVADKDDTTPAVTDTAIKPVDSLSATSNTGRNDQKVGTVSPDVPSEVKQSIAEAGRNPEASTNQAVVEEKKTVEKELLNKIQPLEEVDRRSSGTEGLQGVKSTAGNFTDGPTASGSNATLSPAGGDKKKKNRLSSLLNKLKPKSNKDKA